MEAVGYCERAGMHNRKVVPTATTRKTVTARGEELYVVWQEWNNVARSISMVLRKVPPEIIGGAAHLERRTGEESQPKNKSEELKRAF